ncbi:MAG: glutamate-5-semialdehyde dehydrogenase [Lachnospiraceae bacterium]|nr:glutamate-5-semialdehyde dehydrogenase [Lachnospiraceae bacterium]
MYLEQLGQKASAAKYEVQLLSTENKNNALKAVADALISNTDFIIKENAIDLKNGEENGMHPGLIDRLRLTPERIKAMAEGILQIIDLEDPVGEVLETTIRPNGMEISKVRVPMGVIGIIYESRPNVTADAFALCFKTGNAVILKGGKDAINSNKAITDTIRSALKEVGVTEDAILLIEKTDREATTAFMKLNKYVDVLIPRGGAGLIRAVVENSTIPVIETGTGNCHVYVDEYADFKKALDIIYNAKTQRIGVCNACESLVIHDKIKGEFLPLLAEKLAPANVEIRSDAAAKEILKDSVTATEEDFYKEYLDYIISIKTVGSVEEAIDHINEHNTGHSDCIISENAGNIAKFQKSVDAACVYANVSTRFTDGFEFGFGAEIGISTQKLHARGPMGLKELTSYKYLICGNGQIR